jgi:DNA polymerase-3 subunit delta
MDVPFARLADHLQKGVRSLYVVCGDEPLQAMEAQDAIRQAARAQGVAEREVITASGNDFDWRLLSQQTASLGLFADRKLIEVHIPTGKPGKEGSQALQDWAAQLQQDDAVMGLVVMPALEAAQRKSGWVNALAQNGAWIQVDPVARQALPAWIAQRLARNNQRVADGDVGAQTLAFFADRVEGNLLAAHQEIEKLALLHPAGELSMEAVEQAVLNVARYDVFQLRDAVWTGKAARVQRMLDGLQGEGESAVLVHYTLADDVRALYRLQQAVAEGQPMAMALREQRIWGVRERLFERILPRLSPAVLRQWLHMAHQLDGVIKGLRSPHWPHEAWAALADWAQRMTRVCQNAPYDGAHPSRHA